MSDAIMRRRRVARSQSENRASQRLRQASWKATSRTGRFEGLANMYLRFAKLSDSALGGQGGIELTCRLISVRKENHNG
jgi:hypothetical protein